MHRKFKFVITFMALSVFVLAACRQRAPSTATDTRSDHAAPVPAAEELPRYRYDQLLRRDGIAPIYEPVFVSVLEAELDDDELVLAIEYEDAARARVINDQIGDRPLAIIVEPDSHMVAVYLRTIDGQVLDLIWRDNALYDQQTGSRWMPVNGLAVDGPLEGVALRPVPYVPAFPAAWLEFFPQTEVYQP